MKFRRKLLLDVDGVCVDFRDQYIKACNEVNETSFTVEDIGKIWDIDKALKLTQEQSDKTWDKLCEPGWVLNMKPYGDVEKAIKKLHKYDDIFFLTSPVYKGNWVNERIQWIEKHFPFIAGKNEEVSDHVIFCSSKYKHTIPGDFFIDDKHEVVDRWAQKWGETRGYKAPGYEPVDWEIVHFMLHSR